MTEEPEYELTPGEQAQWEAQGRVELAFFDALEPAALQALGRFAHEARGVASPNSRIVEASTAISLRRIADSLENLEAVMIAFTDGEDNANPHSILKPLWSIAEGMRRLE
jgi:hypothetical protein